MSLSPIHLLILLILLIFLLIVLHPVQRISHRTGHSRWWCLLALIPVVSVAGLWALAYARWPAVAKPTN